VSGAVSPGLEAVILKCLDKDPGLRYQTAKELLVDLERLQVTGSSTSGARHEPTLAEVDRRRRRHRAALTAAAAAVILAVAASLLLALAKKGGFLAGEGLELGGEVLDVSGLGRQREDFVDCGKEVVEGPHRRQWRT
jgi:hypothetical protein